MDKYEYKVRTDEMKELVRTGQFADAMEIADSIDWRRVKNTKMLCVVSDIYKINRKFDESKELLLLAYERNQTSRLIVYSLCELCIKMDEIVEANEYYKEFVRLAPKDNGRYILRYKMYEAQDVSLEERISVLEEYKKREPLSEKWAYELAYLYHRVGLATRCIEECDELFLWFREGKYVLKALELKQLHTPLSAEQQSIYDKQFYQTQRTHIPKTAYDDEDEYEGEEANQEEDIHVKPMDVGEYNTINLQKELAENLKDVIPEGSVTKQPDGEEIFFEDATNPEPAPIFEEPIEVVTGFKQDQPVEASAEEPMEETVEEPIEEESSATAVEEKPVKYDGIELTVTPDEETIVSMDTKVYQPISDEILSKVEKLAAQATGIPQPEETVVAKEKAAEETSIKSAMDAQKVLTAQPPAEMANMLSQEYDGQISLVVPDAMQVEKQITGQLNIIDVMTEWEKMKKQNEEKRAEEVRQRVLEHTGNILLEFDEATNELLAKGPIDSAELDDIPSIDEVPDDDMFTEEGLDEVEELEEEPASDVEEMAEEEISEEEVPDDSEEEPDDELAEELEDEPEEATEEEEPEEEAFEEKATQEEAEKEIEPAEAEADDTVRAFTPEEKMMFHNFVQTKQDRHNLVQALDGMSLASYTGNVLITGDEAADTTTLAKSMIRNMQQSDPNFSGKVAKISGKGLNNKDVMEVLEKLENGALIIESAHQMNEDTVAKLYKGLEREDTGIVVLMEGPKRAIHKFMESNHVLEKLFTSRFDIEGLSDKALVEYGKRYAMENEYGIDELAVLALHSRIDELQTNDHAVTVDDVKEIMDEAIRRANKKNLKHFFDVLCSKRYDDDDMIVLRERDFDVE